MLFFGEELGITHHLPTRVILWDLEEVLSSAFGPSEVGLGNLMGQRQHPDLTLPAMSENMSGTRGGAFRRETVATRDEYRTITMHEVSIWATSGNDSLDGIMLIFR